MAEKWTFTNRVATLGEMADMTKAGKGDWDAIARLIASRSEPPRSVDEARSLSMDEIASVVEALLVGINEAIITTRLTEQFSRMGKGQ